MKSSGFIDKLAQLVMWLSLAAWGGLLNVLLSLLFYLSPLAAEKQPAAILILALVLPLSFYFLQGLLYLPRRNSEAPVFIRPLLSATPLVFLILPFNSSLETGPELEAMAADEKDDLLNRAAERLKLPLTGRLALLLNARSPMDLAFKTLMKTGFPLLNRLVALLYLIIGPARLLMKLWGYLAWRLWRLSGADPGETDEVTPIKRAEVFDLDYQARRLHQTQELTAFYLRLKSMRIDEDQARLSSGEIYNKYDPVWLNPRYRGLYLDFPVTLWAAKLEDMYDGGPEEPGSFFYPPELGVEIETISLMRAERRRLNSSLNGDLLLWLDGRLRPSWVVENEIEGLDFEIKRREKRLTAHHRRCRSSSLAAARRRGGEWPELLRKLGLELFYVERQRPDLKAAVLTALLEAEEAVYGSGDIGELNAQANFIDEAELEAFYQPQSFRSDEHGLKPGYGEKTPTEREIPWSSGRRPDISADSFGLGFGRSSLALILLSLLIWQGFSQGLVMLSIYNGLACQVELSINGAQPVAIPAFGGASSIKIKDGRFCHLKVYYQGRLVDDFSGKPLGPNMIYNIAGAAVFFEWPSPDVAEQEASRFLGRPRWFNSLAAFLPDDFLPPIEKESGGWLLVAVGNGRPGKMLALLNNEKDRVELIRAHASWDEPTSQWFQDWIALVEDSGLRADILLQHIKADPFFLEKMAESWSDNGE